MKNCVHVPLSEEIPMIKKYLRQVQAGDDLSFEQAVELAEYSSPTELYDAADELRKSIHGNDFDLCSIVNARSGRCSENCKFCAQSSHYEVDVATYDIVAGETALKMALQNEEQGVRRFSLVTAGRSVSHSLLDEIETIYQLLEEKTDMLFCASMGFLTREKAERLRAMGVRRYHCNLETCRSFFKEVCTTHTWEEKVETIQIARQAGMDICSGGIIGMGESREQRLELAFELRDLGILSIPINILTPIANTPFSHLKPLGVGEVLTTIALFRFINPRAVIRLAGGRNLLGDQQDRCFMSGANGAIVGDYLTTVGNSLREDVRMVKNLGFDIDRKDK